MWFLSGDGLRCWCPRVVASLLLAGVLPATAQFPDAPRDDLPPLAERRAAVLKQFDRDSDGLLQVAEREAARKAWAARMLTQRRDRGMFQPPPEILAEFDANKDGELDDEEGRVAGETMGRRFEQMRKDYDKNTNGRLDQEEIDFAVADIDAGKLKGIPKMFVQFAGGGPGRRGGGPGGPRGRGGPGGPEGDSDPAAVVRSADRDGDGRLSAAELAGVRAEWARRRAAAPVPRTAPAPGAANRPNP